MARLIVLLLLVPCLSLAQKSAVDPLRQLNPISPIDTVRGRMLCRQCAELWKAGQYAEALATGLQGLDVCQQDRDLRGQAMCSNNLGNVYKVQGDHPQALAAYARSLGLFEQLGNWPGVAACYNNLGNIHYEQGDYRQALAQYQHSLAIRERVGNQAGIANSLNNIGFIYRLQGDYARALDCYQRSLRIQQQVGNRSGEAYCLTNLGELYLDQGDVARALEVFMQSLNLREAIGDRAGIGLSLMNIANLHSKTGDLARAKAYYARSLDLAEQSGEPASIAICLNNLGYVYRNEGQYGQALAHFQRSLYLFAQLGDKARMANGWSNLAATWLALGGVDSARTYAQRGLAQAQAVGDLQLKKYGAQVRFQVDSAAGNWQSAFRHLRLYMAYADSMRNDEQSRELGRLEARYEAEQGIAQRDLAITKLEADRLRKDLLLQNQRSQLVLDSLAHARQTAELEANSLRLADRIHRQEVQRERDSLANARIVERHERLRIETEGRLARQRLLLGSAGIGLLLVGIIAYLLFRSRRKGQAANRILQALNDEVQTQKAQIEAYNAELYITLAEVNDQKSQLADQHAKIEDSIRYASFIQRAILPQAPLRMQLLPPHFMYYQPRDLVSGDFCWIGRQAGRTYLAVVDCTGHGVPGAFMSLLGALSFDQLVLEMNQLAPGLILKALDRRITRILQQGSGGTSHDGMDVALVVLHDADADGARVVEFAGAGRPLWHVSGAHLREYKSARYPCGGSQHPDKEFPVHRIDVRPGDRLYVFTDGITDQFGGPLGRKLGPARLHAFLAGTAALTHDEQGRQFAAFFAEWMGGRKQLDDVLLVGLAV